MTPNVHLYLFPGSCALAVDIMLRHCGIPVITTALSPRQGIPEDLLLLNPKGKVPFLTLNDEVVTEVPAIMSLISQLAPEKHILGNTDMDIVRAYEWMNWISGTLHGQAYAQLFKPSRFVDDEGLFGAVREKGKKTIRECYVFIEEKLDGKSWAVGDAFTAVDAYLFVFYRWGNGNGFDMKNEFPNYARMVEGVVKVDGVKEAVEAEGIDLLVDAW